MTMHHTEESERNDQGSARGGGDAGGLMGEGGGVGGEVYASDPVCGMDVAVSDTQFTSEVAGDIYYFCSQSCRARFEKHPEKYT